ncbi:MAG TPA: hypothetical protein VKV40_24945 [Ktedonobacteraceae bacterium]|nr:hypothetical protein [Ktedonobacteraceae bacterium]
MEEKRTPAGYFVPIVVVLGATLLMPPFPLFFLLLIGLALLTGSGLLVAGIIWHVCSSRKKANYFSSQEPLSVSQSRTVSGMRESAACLVEQRGKV